MGELTSDELHTACEGWGSNCCRGGAAFAVGQMP